MTTTLSLFWLLTFVFTIHTILFTRLYNVWKSIDKDTEDEKYGIYGLFIFVEFMFTILIINWIVP